MLLPGWCLTECMLLLVVAYEVSVGWVVACMHMCWASTRCWVGAPACRGGMAGHTDFGETSVLLQHQTCMRAGTCPGAARSGHGHHQEERTEAVLPLALL